MPTKQRVTKKKSTPAKRAPRKKKPVPLANTTMAGTSVAHGHSPHEHSQARLNEKNRHLIMWLGVSVVMTAIVIFWILNLNQLLGPNAFSMTPTDPQSVEDFDNLKRDLSDTFGEVKSTFQGLEEIAPSETVAPSLTVSPELTPAVSETVLPNILPQ